MSPGDILLCCAFAVTLPIGQVMFKFAAMRHATLQGSIPRRLIANPILIAACAWYGMTALFWFFVLTRLPLVAAYPFAIAGSATVPFVSSLVFKEKLSAGFAGGFILMVLGLGMVVLA
jgi:drug/metabolite transporter (DMT)-like permease